MTDLQVPRRVETYEEIDVYCDARTGKANIAGVRGRTLHQTSVDLQAFREACQERFEALPGLNGYRVRMEVAAAFLEEAQKA